MPSTVNGIGTHYYGKKNAQERQGVCSQCHGNVTLTSYDTRLWFVVVFIPVIPLGRKRIIDYCSNCSRHYAIELDKWEATKQLEISGALDKYRTAPTPELAIEVHQRLLEFHQYEQAAAFRQQLKEKFPDHAKVQLHLGFALTHLGRPGDAEPHFLRALELRPDLPEARVSVAQIHLRAGRLDDARRLLDFLEKTGAVQLYSLVPLEELGNAYQQAARDREALEVFGKLLEALPELKQNAAFRKKILRSEAHLGSQVSILPKKQFHWKNIFALLRSPQPIGGSGITWRGLAGVGAVVGVILVGLVIGNEYTRRHRRLYVVADFKEPVTVTVRGVGSVTLRQGMEELRLPEGRHHATLTGAVRDEVEFEVRSEFLDRWFADPAWVLNAGGSAILMLETAVYSQNAPPAESTFHYGRAFEFFPEVTHPFQPLPQSVRMKAHETRRYTQLERFTMDPAALFQHFERKGQIMPAMDLAEWRLRLQPDDEGLLQSYLVVAQLNQQVDRLERFLRSGLAARPLRINWHRYYQSLRPEQRRSAQLVAEYDALLQAEPGNAALLYLRGRVCESLTEGRGWFERARAADGANPYPLYALGYDRMSLGDWAGARPLLARAVELQPRTRDFASLFEQCRLALGEHAAMETEIRAALAKQPADYSLTVSLCDVLVAQRRSAEAEKVIAAFEAALNRPGTQSPPEISQSLRRHWLYMAGDFAGLEKLTATDQTPAGRIYRFQSLIEQGRLAEAVKLQPLDDPKSVQAVHFLAVSIAWRLAGDAVEAGRWQARGVQLLQAGDARDRRAGELLTRATPPTNAELDELGAATHVKAIYLALLARLHPAQRLELNAAARRLNVERSYPFHLLQRATEPAN